MPFGWLTGTGFDEGTWARDLTCSQRLTIGSSDRGEGDGNVGIVRMRVTIAIIILTALLADVPTYGAAVADPAVTVTISDVDGNWEITVPVSHVTLVVPEAGLRVIKKDGGGSMNSPRYFLLKDDIKGERIVSGWFESALRVKDVKQTLQGSWDGEGVNLKNAGFEPFDVVFGDIGDWATISYQIQVPPKADSSVHVRASRIIADTWIDLHLSVTSGETADDNRALVTQLLKSMTVRVR
jgi:hypothetical protein